MVKTHGLTHISLDVRDPERSLRFYEQVFGVREYYPDESSIQALGPGTRAVLAFERNVSSAGRKGGIEHLDHDGVSPVRPAREELGASPPARRPRGHDEECYYSPPPPPRPVVFR